MLLRVYALELKFQTFLISTWDVIKFIFNFNETQHFVFRWKDCVEESDFPLFYVTPIIEISDCPFLPVYKFKLSSCKNLRQHNFHLISDIHNSVDVTEEFLLNYCNKVHPLELPVADVLQQMDSSSNCHKTPERIMSLPLTKKLKFLPLCQQL